MSHRSVLLGLVGLSGASAVAAGAVGAHAMQGRSETMKDVWKTATQYHLIHTVAAGIATCNFTGRKSVIVSTLFLSGIFLFSGSCYTVVIMNQRKPYSYPAPVGGIALIGGWLALGLLP